MRTMTLIALVLKGMFNLEIIYEHDAKGTSKEESAKMTYFAMLSTIINI